MAIPDNGHVWVAATYVPLTSSEAKYAERRGIIRLGERPADDGRPGIRVEILEVSCHECRQPFVVVWRDRCSALDTTEHLRGGPIGERKKRGPRPRDADTDVPVDLACATAG